MRASKGAMLSHGNLLHNVESCRLVLQTVEHDRFAVLLPMFHSYMLTVGLLLPDERRSSPELLGFDVAGALRRLAGNERLYDSLLVQFVEQQAGADQDLREALAGEDRGQFAGD